MKTTLELPDELMRAVKLRAVNEDRRLKDVMADVIRRGLAEGQAPGPSKRVRLPLVECAHEARHQDEVTPERAAEILLEEDANFLQQAK